MQVPHVPHLSRASLLRARQRQKQVWASKQQQEQAQSAPLIGVETENPNAPHESGEFDTVTWMKMFLEMSKRRNNWRTACCASSSIAIGAGIALLLFGLVLRTAMPQHMRSVVHSLGEGELCLPMDADSVASAPFWYPRRPWDGTPLKGLDTGDALKPLFGGFSLGWIGLGFGLPGLEATDLNIDSDEKEDTFVLLGELSSSKEFKPTFERSGGIWGWMLKVMDVCKGVAGFTSYAIFGYDEVVEVVQDRELLTKQDSIADFIFKHKVLLNDYTDWPSECQKNYYNNVPTTLLNMDEVHVTAYSDLYNRLKDTPEGNVFIKKGKDSILPRWTRDLYKRVYLNGFYDADHGATADELANQASCYVMGKIEEEVAKASAQPDFEPFAQDECPNFPGLPGALCVIWPAFMDVTMHIHLGDPDDPEPELQYNLTDLRTSMHNWMYYGFNEDLFTRSSERTSTDQKTPYAKTRQAAAHLLCEFGRLAKAAYKHKRFSQSAQARWLMHANNTIEPVRSLFNSDAAATETLHNALAMAMQYASAIAHAMRNMANWADQFGSMVLMTNDEARRNFVRETFRQTPPGVPFLFSRRRDTGEDIEVPYPERLAKRNTYNGDRTGSKVSLPGKTCSTGGCSDGSDQSYEGTVKMVFLSVPALQSENPMWRQSDPTLSSDQIYAPRSRYNASKCPFLRRQSNYNIDLKRGGHGITDPTTTAHSGYNISMLQPLAQTDPNSNTADCVAQNAHEQNVFLANSSADEDLETWMTSLSGFRPNGVGYRRCPGEPLTWRTVDKIVKALGSNYIVTLSNPAEDARGTQRFGLAAVPINGPRLTLTRKQASVSALGWARPDFTALCAGN